MAHRNFEHLWDYCVHYFDGLFGEEPDEAEKWRWIDIWIDSVPPGSRPGWDPYPSSRRIVNWVKWAISSGSAPDNFRQSLAAQTRYLERNLEYHLLANHLLANAVALTMAGVFFGGVEGDGWLDRGARLLDAQLDEQFLDDGAHYELSPVYHSVILEDLLDLLQVFNRAGLRPLARLESTARRATGWLACIVRADGKVPLFNDGAYGVAAEPAELFAYAEALGVGGAPPLPKGLTVLEASGYFRYAYGRLFLLGDVGGVGPSYMPGHAHCDMLNFDLVWDGQPTIGDTGTSTYEVVPRRALERGTAAHNTVQLGRLEQSEIWAGFRMARRAKIAVTGKSADHVEAAIRAFPPRWLTLARRWTFDRETVVIDDRAVSERRSDLLTARLHFHPSVAPAGSGSRWVVSGLRIGFDGALDVREREYHQAPEFNRLVPARCLEVDFRGRLRTTLGP
jgi:uncharacterized heparinase superfamily protein